jgi:hypothetical protein
VIGVRENTLADGLGTFWGCRGPGLMGVL